MNEARFEEISGFVDGEPVDVRRLIDGLTDADGQAFLLDALRLRLIAAGPMALAPIPRTDRDPRLAARRSLIAAAAVLAALVGFGVGATWAPDDDDDLAPPTASRIVRLETAAPGAPR